MLLFDKGLTREQELMEPRYGAACDVMPACSSFRKETNRNCCAPADDVVKQGGGATSSGLCLTLPVSSWINIRRKSRPMILRPCCRHYRCRQFPATRPAESG